MVKLDRPLYHGTSNASSIMIIRVSGFKAPVYLTTDRQRAEHYAKAATAYLEQYAKDEGGSLIAEGYAVFTFRSLPNIDHLSPDDYSPNEPDQYVYQGRIGSLSHFVIDRYPLDVTPEEHLRLQCFAIGMWRR